MPGVLKGTRPAVAVVLDGVPGTAGDVLHSLGVARDDVRGLVELGRRDVLERPGNERNPSDRHVPGSLSEAVSPADADRSLRL